MKLLWSSVSFLLTEPHVPEYTRGHLFLPLKLFIIAKERFNNWYLGPEQTLYDDWSYVVCPGLDSLTWGRTMMFSHLKYTLTDWLTWRQSWSFPWAWWELRKRWDSSCDNVWPDIQTLCWPVRPGEKSARCRLPLIVCYPWNEVFMKLYRNYFVQKPDPSLYFLFRCAPLVVFKVPESYIRHHRSWW